MYPNYGGVYAASPTSAPQVVNRGYAGYSGMSPGFTAAAPQVAYGGGAASWPVSAYGPGRPSVVHHVASPVGYASATPQVAYGGGRTVVHAASPFVAPQSPTSVRLAAGGTPRVAQSVYAGGSHYITSPAAAPQQVRYVQQGARPSVVQHSYQQQLITSQPAQQPYQQQLITSQPAQQPYQQQLITSQPAKPYSGVIQSQKSRVKGSDPKGRREQGSDPAYSVNHGISGSGGALNQKPGRRVCVVFAFNYKPAPGYNPMKDRPLCELTSITDAERFAQLSAACGVETRVFLDAEVPGIQSMGWPDRATMVEQLQSLARELGEDDELVFFYGGHGMASLEACVDNQEDDGHDEELCLVDRDGTYNGLKDDDFANCLLQFNPGTKILVVTDCCQSGTVCDLSKAGFKGREIAHIAAVKDSQYAADWGDGGGFTTCVLETLEDCAEIGQTEISIVQVHNQAYEKFCKAYPDEAQEIEFCFEQPSDLDPDTFQWILVPPAGYKVSTLLDQM